MMKEFQAENERRQILSENNPTNLLNATSNEIVLQAATNVQSQITISSTSTDEHHVDDQLKTVSNQTKIHTTERPPLVDRTKLYVKTNRYTSNTVKVNFFELISQLKLRNE